MALHGKLTPILKFVIFKTTSKVRGKYQNSPKVIWFLRPISFQIMTISVGAAGY